MPVKLLLVDDHAIIREGLTRALQNHEDFDVVGQADTGLSAIKRTRKLSPDIIIMDISMPDMNGMDATWEIKRDFPEVKIIALSMHSSRKFISEMFKCGASGYLLKDCSLDELIQAIRTVTAGNNYISPDISDVAVDLLKGAEGEERSPFSKLTRREREVLQLLAEGRTTKQAGALLHVSPKTIEAHRLRIINKLGINSIAQLTKYAIQQGLVSLDT